MPSKKKKSGVVLGKAAIFLGALWFLSKLIQNKPIPRCPNCDLALQDEIPQCPRCGVFLQWIWSTSSE